VSGGSAKKVDSNTSWSSLEMRLILAPLKTSIPSIVSFSRASRSLAISILDKVRLGTGTMFEIEKLYNGQITLYVLICFMEQKEESRIKFFLVLLSVGSGCVRASARD
jgi:hypothetical protein